MPRPRNLATRMRNPSLRGSIAENTDLVLIIIIGDVGVKLAAFLVTEELVAALCAEHEMNDDVGEGLGHTGNALTGLGRFVATVDLSFTEFTVSSCWNCRHQRQALQTYIAAECEILPTRHGKADNWPIAICRNIVHLFWHATRPVPV